MEILRPQFRHFKVLFRGDHEYLRKINGKNYTRLRKFNDDVLNGYEIENDEISKNFQFLKKYKMRMLSVQLTDPKMLAM